MAEGDYKKLLAWCKESGYELAVGKPTSPLNGKVYWTLAVSIDDPVEFDAAAKGDTIDEAAAGIIADIRTVGGRIS